MKRIIAIILEAIPVIAAPLFLLLVRADFDSDKIRGVILVAMLLGLFGFAFFFIGRKLAKGDRAVQFLGALDWAASVSVVAFYILAIFSFGL